MRSPTPDRRAWPAAVARLHPAGRIGASSRFQSGRPWAAGALLIALAAGAIAAHDPGRMLSQPLWRDENWVAVTLRSPLGRLPALTSSTPLLFTALLRVTPHADPPQLRLLPLAFTVAAIWPAYLLGRELDGKGRLTRVALSAGVAFAPTLLIRHDLKQYTAEGFDALLLLWLGARLERDWSGRRLAALALVVAASPLLSNGAFFLAPALLIGIAIGLIVRHRTRHLPQLLAAGLAALVVDAALALGIDSRGDTASVRVYWESFYVPTGKGWSEAFRFIDDRASAELHAVGLGPALAVAALLLAGLATLATTEFPGLALAVPLATLEQVAAASLHQYPLWDERTSTWYTLGLFVVALIGLTGLARLAVHLASVPYRGLAAGAAVAVATTAAAIALAWPYAHAADTAIRTRTPLEDVHGQVQTILAERRPGDVVVANDDAGFGLGVYWPAPPLLVTDQARLETFRVTYPASDRVVVAATISTAAEVAAVRTAVAMAGAVHGRVWIVLSHWHPAERTTMLATLSQYGSITVPPDQHGLEKVMLLVLRYPLAS